MNTYTTTLLIDNDHVSNFLNYAILKRNNISDDIIIRGNGNSALVYLNEYIEAHNHLPHLILLSLNLPVMDGFQFLEEYKKFSFRLKENTTLIVVSNFVPQDIKRLEKEGYPYITKPLRSDSLAFALNHAAAYVPASSSRH